MTDENERTEDTDEDAAAIRAIMEGAGVQDVDLARFILAIERGEIAGDVVETDEQGRPLPVAEQRRRRERDTAAFWAWAHKK